MNALVRYDEACRALSEARRVDEALDIRDKAEGLRAYARQAKNRGLECDAAEIRFRAERRLGELIAERKRDDGLAKGSRGQLVGRGVIGGPREEPPIPTLADIGVDKKLSSRAQALAHVAPARFESMVGEWRARVADENERVTTALLKEGERSRESEAFAERTADGCSVADLESLAASGRLFGAILADPPWRYRTYSKRGEDRSPARHYDIATQLQEIITLPVGRLAAENCVLFLWAMDWDANLTMASTLMSAWGFAHKTTAFTWAKQNASGEGWHMGNGYWTRANPETCLLATRGSPRRLDAGVRQLIVAPVAEHSRKPDEAHERIERLVAGPYLELYGRRPRAGWTVWGNEIAREDFDVAAAIDDAGEPLGARRSSFRGHWRRPRRRDRAPADAGAPE